MPARYFSPLFMMAFALLVASCTETVVSRDTSARFMRLDDLADPWYGWPGTTVYITGEGLAEPDAVFSARIGQVPAQVVDANDDRIAVRIPAGATEDEIIVKRDLGWRSEEQPVSFQIVRSPYVINTFAVASTPITVWSIYTRTMNDGTIETDTAAAVLLIQQESTSSGVKGKSFCRDLPSDDTLRVCWHDDSYSVASDGSYYSQSDNAARMIAIVDSVRGVISSLRIETNWSSTKQSSALVTETEHAGWVLELRDVPYTRDVDGSLRATLDGNALRALLVEYRRTSASQYRTGNDWRSLNVTSTELEIPSTTEMTITLKYREPWH